MSIDRYQHCPCGSGKKFKFCCNEKYGVLTTASDEELCWRSGEFRIYESRISPDWQNSGVAEVLVVRQMPNLKYIAGAYLVDAFCLGLKDTFFQARLSEAEVRVLRNRFPEKLEEIPYEDARSVILGAIEYARRIGFEPHEDWRLSGRIVEAERSFNNKFTFGSNGKPFYVQGPNDDASKILRTLGPLIDRGQADFLTIDELVETEDDCFYETCDCIEQDLAAQRFSAAQQKIKAFMKDYPRHWRPGFYMGTCLAMQGDPQRAIPLLDASIKIHPTAEAYCNLAGAHRSLLEIPQFLASLEKVIEIDGATGEIGRKAQAEMDEFYAVATKGTGLSQDQYRDNAREFDTAFVSLMKGLFEEAVNGFNRVLRLQPNHIQSHGNLGLAYAGLGDRDTALWHLNRALELDPRYQPAIDNRRAVLELQPGEKLQFDHIREVDFYADKVRTSPQKPHARGRTRALTQS